MPFLFYYSVIHGLDFFICKRKRILDVIVQGDLWQLLRKFVASLLSALIQRTKQYNKST